MNKDFSLHRYALEVFSKYDFKDYQTQIYDLSLNCNNFFGEDIIENILKESTKQNNYNKITNGKTLCLFTYIKNKKKAIFIKIESLERKAKISLLLEDKNKIDNFTQNKKITKQESIDKNFYNKIFSNLNEKIEQFNEESDTINYFKYDYPSIELLESNKERNSLRNIIDSKEFDSLKSSLPWVVGTKYNGSKYIADLTKMPNLLIAGSNSSEINTCINTIILSILYKSQPNKVRFMFIGSKNKISIYRYMPHYHIRVVEQTNFSVPLKDSIKIKELIKIMDKRYEKYAKNMVRNIEEYNQEITEKNKQDYYIVVIINDLADLILTKNSKKSEELIIKLLKFGKMVGIHLVVATQIPTETAIPFDIRANIPSRLAFKVKSAKESNVILDCDGAEKLTGKGDMLFLSQSKLKPIHIRSAFVSEKEVKKVIKFLSKQEQCIN